DTLSLHDALPIYRAPPRGITERYRFAGRPRAVGARRRYPCAAPSLLGQASSMDLRELAADDTAAVRLAAGIENARNVLDAPWELPVAERRMAMEVRYGWEWERGRFLLVYDGDTLVGLAHIGTSKWDNLDLAWLDVKVLPEHRRRG